MFVKMENNKQLPQSPEQYIENGNEFSSALEDPRSWSAIPLLNYTPLHELKDMNIVRFRGMIQDMQDPEIYLERYEVKGKDGCSRVQEGKYRDCLVLHPGEEVNYDCDKNIQGERRTLFVVSIPGLNSWANDYEQTCNRGTLPAEKRVVETSAVNKKRHNADDDDGMEVDSQDNINSNKRQCKDVPCTSIVKANSSQKMLGTEYLLNSPIPERPSKACMIKIYNDFDSYTLNSIVDVVGFLSVDPALDMSLIDSEMSNDFDMNELQAQNPPPSLIPRLHAISVYKMPHLNPLLDARFQVVPDEEMNMLSVQKDLRMLLTLCLFNDDLAADYLLSHLISTVYNRSDFESIGKFTLNLCNVPKEVLPGYTNQLYEILEQLLPASHYLPMTLDNMNTSSFAPRKDYETNKLVAGLLQLAPHTHLVLDETQMQQGKLEANGVKAIQSIAYLIKQQQIKCNFQYYEIDYNTDIPVLVLSEGKSMLPNDFTLPLRADAEAKQLIPETLKAAHHYLQPGRLDQFRRFLTKAKTFNFTLKPEDSEMIQADFVEMRKANVAANADDLHSLLVLSRLLAIARGKQVLDKESWELAKELEVKRRKRIQELPKSSRNLRN